MVAPKSKSFDKLFRSGLGQLNPTEFSNVMFHWFLVLLEKLSGAIVCSSMDDKDPVLLQKNGSHLIEFFVWSCTEGRMMEEILSMEGMEERKQGCIPLGTSRQCQNLSRSTEKIDRRF